MKLRTSLKSRNGGNYSLSENRDGGSSALAGNFVSNIENMNRGSLGAINPKTYDTDSSLFNDLKNNLGENSFNEQILDKNKLMF